jgi:uncharacterized protein (TIGR02117 family)
MAARAVALRWMILTLRAVAIASLFLLAYVLAGLAGGAIMANSDWTPASHGVTIHVETNGVHTSIVVPARHPLFDWTTRIAPDHLPDPRYAGTHYAIGWGERDFYLNTPRWADVDPRVLIRAAIGSDRTLMHVDHMSNPIPGPHSRALTITPDQYRRLVAFILDSFGTDPSPIPGYGPADLFYQARGRYDLINTCNSWTGAALRAAGVRVGVWTPFADSVMRSFPDPAAINLDK